MIERPVARSGVPTRSETKRRFNRPETFPLASYLEVPVVRAGPIGVPPELEGDDLAGARHDAARGSGRVSEKNGKAWHRDVVFLGLVASIRALDLARAR